MDATCEINHDADFKIVLKKQYHPVQVIWLLNKIQIKPDDTRYLISHDENENSFSLKIKNLSIDDAGSISANVSNIFGQVSTSCQLFIKCKYFFPFH